MARMTVTRAIGAPVAKVFDTVAHVENFSKAVPHIVKVEFLSQRRAGVGTRFRETRLMGKKEATAEFEVAEYVANERIRIVAEQHGTVWDTVFTVKPQGGDGTELTMVMDAKAKKLLPKLLNPLFMGLIRKAVGKDLDAVKAYCEQSRKPDDAPEV